MSSHVNVPSVITVDLARLTIHPLAIRGKYKPEELQAMAAAFCQYGQLSPVLVRKRGGIYELLSGTRHLLAAECAGMKTLQATVCIATDAQAIELVGLEHVVYCKLNPLERSRYVLKLMRPTDQGGGGLSLEQVMKRFGKSAEWVRRTRDLNNLPEPWRGRLAAGKLSESFCAVLLPYVANQVVIRCIEWHQFRHPNLWKTRADWCRLSRLIDRTYEQLRKAEGWERSEIVPCLGREIRATASPDYHAEERIQRHQDRLDEEIAKEDAVTLEDLGYRMRLSEDAARGLLMPFEDCLADLMVLADVLHERITQLEVPS